MINRHQLDCLKHFEENPTNGGVYLNEKGRQIVLSQWKNSGMERISTTEHPNGIPLNKVTDQQVRRLEKALDESHGEYMPHLIK